jgi:hypothetical protein
MLAGHVIIWTMRRVVLVALVACGRGRFDPIPGDASRDVPGDTSDAPGDTPPPGCNAQLELCDDFEAAQLDVSKWMWDPGVTLDATVAHRGSHAVHFQSTAVAMSQQGFFRLYETTTLPLGDPTFYVRAWVRFGALPTSTNGMEVIAAYQTTGGSMGDYLFLHANSLNIYDEFTSGYASTTAPPALDTWLCLLWTVHRDTGATGSITLAGDPESLLLPNQQTDTSPPIAALTFGIGFSAPNVDVPQPPMEMWMDDVIVDKSPLTCAQ